MDQPEDVMKYNATRVRPVVEEEAGPQDGIVPFVAASGAKSSERKPDYHLVPFGVFLRRLAARYSAGSEKYGKGNWRRGLGDQEYVMERANHTLEHLLKAMDDFDRGVTTGDDDLAAVIWGAIFLMAAQRELGLRKE